MKYSVPKLMLHAEGFVVLCAAVLLYRETGASWGKFVVLFLAPDLLAIGYVFGRKVGAHTYNLGHTYTAPFLLWLICLFGHQPVLLPLCLIWIAHIGFDRLLGYGLKYDTAFKATHLNRV